VLKSSSRSAVQWYGSRPLHESKPGRRRSFPVNMAVGRYDFHRCLSHGNPLELWAAPEKLPLNRAAIDLCNRLGRDIPRIQMTSQLIAPLNRGR
jgi:hypothetical protein